MKNSLTLVFHRLLIARGRQKQVPTRQKDSSVGALRPWVKLCALCSLIVALTGCPKPLPPVEATPEDDPPPTGCPPPFQLSSSIAETEMLSRVMREGRANLMARATVDNQTVLATLYHPYLALVEAALNDPKQARDKKGEWLERKLLRTYVELRAPRALNLVNAVHRMSLRERDSGKRYPALSLIEQRQSDQGWRARIAFESPAWSTNEPFLSVELQIPGAKQSGTASWGISPRTLTSLNRLPIVFELAPLRAVRMARRALLRGETSAAKRLLGDVPQCAECFKVAEQLSKLASALPPSGSTEEDEPGQAESEPAAGPLMLRAAILRQLGPLVGALVDEKGFVEAKRLLERFRQGAAAANSGKLAAAFDQKLALVLRQSLYPHSSIGQLDSARLANTANGTAELRRRLAYANAGLQPYFVDGSKYGSVALSEQQPLLAAKDKSGFTITARLRQRVGQWWGHPGLPALKYSVRLVDNAGAYWADRVRAASSADALKKVAREMVHREMQGPDLAVAEAALEGWVSIEGRRSLKVVVALAEGTAAERAAAALSALRPLSRTAAVRKLIQRYTTAKEPVLRAAALVLKGRLKQALRDPSPRVAFAAFAAMLRRGQGINVARQWLKNGPAQRRRDTLSLLARRGAAGSLKGVLGTLYKSTPALRPLIVAAARGKGYRALLLHAATDDDAAVRQAAISQLSRLARPPRGALKTALKDKNERVRLAAHVGLVRLGQSQSLLALGSGARGGCGERQVVLEALITRMDRNSGRKLLIETLNTADCPALAVQAWKVAAAHFRGDPALLRIGMAHSLRRVRVNAALTALGFGKGRRRK